MTPTLPVRVAATARRTAGWMTSMTDITEPNRVRQQLSESYERFTTVLEGLDADVVTFTTHKVLRGPRGGMLVCKAEHAAAIDKAVFPMMQGGPLMHAVAAKDVALKEAATPEYEAYARQVIVNAQALAAGLGAEGMRPVSGGTDTHLALIDIQGAGTGWLH